MGRRDLWICGWKRIRHGRKEALKEGERTDRVVSYRLVVGTTPPALVLIRPQRPSQAAY